MRLKDRVAIVTGGASGIGLAVVRKFCAEGAPVVLVDRDRDAAQTAAQSVIKDIPGASVEISVCDVSREEEVAESVSRAVACFGGVDVIVNNAGLMIFKPLEEHTADDWQKVMAVDLLGAFFFTREGFRRMKQGGAIINVSSVHAVETTPNVAAYAAAKAALVSLTHTAAIEGKEKGIRVNSVLPGAVDTPMLWSNPNIKAGLEVIRKSDVGKPEDIAGAIAYLASEDAAFVTGAALSVDGGRLSRL